MPHDHSTDVQQSDASFEDDVPAPVRVVNVDAMNPQEAFAAGEAAGEALKGKVVAPASVPSVRTRKIALLGTAPQWQAAPFDDPTWEIWGLFGVTLVAKRLTRLFELHDKNIIEQMVKQYSPDGRYWEVCKKMGKEFYTRDAFEQAPEAQRFDFEGKMKRYGKYFASSASWMLAEALDQNPAEIGIFGVNMAADEEYAHQKPSLSYLIGWGKAQGIKFTIPSSSELMSLTHQYGLEDPPRFLASVAQRKHEINQHLAIAKQNIINSQLQAANAEGALQQVQWFEQNFSAEHKGVEKQKG